MKTKLMFATLTCLLAVLVVTDSADATFVDTSGLACQPSGPLLPSYDIRGAAARNIRYDIPVHCPVSLGRIETNPAPEGALYLLYQDGNTSRPFSCTFCISDMWGNTNCTDARFTCSTVGGCDSSNPRTADTGSGYLLWYPVPEGLNLHYVGVNAYFSCTIPSPGRGPDRGISAVLAYHSNG